MSSKFLLSLLAPWTLSGWGVHGRFMSLHSISYHWWHFTYCKHSWDNVTALAADSGKCLLPSPDCRVSNFVSKVFYNISISKWTWTVLPLCSWLSSETSSVLSCLLFRYQVPTLLPVM